jgi:hypothetical protein
MKAFIALAALLFSVQSFANANEQSAEFKQEVLELLISQSSNIQLTELGENSDAKLANILADHLMAGSYLKAGRNVVLTSTSVSCENTTPEGLLGSQSFECSVVLLNGDFSKRGNKLTGPSAESAYSLSKIKLNRVVYPNAKLQLTDNKVEVSFAG